MSSRPTTPTRALAAVAVLALAASCGPTVRRDLTAMPQRQITYDDMCRLQAHFDQRAAAHAAPYRVIDEQSLETSRQAEDERGQMRPVVVGEGTYVIRDRTDRLALRRLLRQEYDRLPDLRALGREGEVRLHVHWWRSGTIRRLIPEEEIALLVNGESHELPHNPCVGEFLFGDEAYAMRRNVMSAERARAHGELPREYLPDGGAAPAPTPAPTPAPADASADASADAATDAATD